LWAALIPDIAAEAMLMHQSYYTWQILLDPGFIY
jgi:hypothetical protein